MQLRLRQCLAVLALLLSAAACSDSPTAPAVSPENLRPSEGGAYIPPEDGGCDKYTSPNFCQGPGTGTCITSTPGTLADVGVQSCPGDEGGGSYTHPPADDPPADTCLAGDEAFDAPAVKQGLNDLWARSNPDAPQAQRLEQAGWIMQRTDGSYYMAPFSTTAQGPCKINGNLHAPQGAIAWVHTHPFAAGEVQTICGALKEPDPNAPGAFRDMRGPDGQLIYPTYDNKPSFPDRELMHDMNYTRRLLGQTELSGVIIDANQTTVYTETAGDGVTVLPRCGY